MIRCVLATFTSRESRYEKEISRRRDLELKDLGQPQTLEQPQHLLHQNSAQTKDKVRDIGGTPPGLVTAASFTALMLLRVNVDCRKGKKMEKGRKKKKKKQEKSKKLIDIPPKSAVFAPRIFNPVIRKSAAIDGD
jgi:hypothetical protein